MHSTFLLPYLTTEQPRLIDDTVYYFIEPDREYFTLVITDKRALDNGDLVESERFEFYDCIKHIQEDIEEIETILEISFEEI